MRPLAPLVALLTLALPAVAQKPAPPPHAWLFGAWTGGLFPPPVTLNAQECLAQPSVIFTRDTVMRESLTAPAYVQRLVETVRAIPGGAEFRFVAAPKPPRAASGMFDVMPDSAADIGFGCRDPDALQVRRRGENEISFPNCPAFPYPLIRCPAR